MEEWDYEDEADGYPLRVTRTPMVAGGMSVMEAVQREKPSIFRPPGNFGEPRVHLPKENPKYPETKHTVKCVPPWPAARTTLVSPRPFHNITLRGRIRPTQSQKGDPQYFSVLHHAAGWLRVLRPGHAGGK